MQWRRKRRVLLVIGSARHPLLLSHLSYDPKNPKNPNDLDKNANGHGTEEEGGLSLEAGSSADPRRITFNEDEYTKITTPRQDVLFKKGYFGRKRTTNPSPSETQDVHSGDSVESEAYVCEEPQYVYPAGYMDPSGVYYVNAGNAFETYDPYTGAVTVVVGPPPQYPGAPVLAALPCQPVPLQPLEWFNPPAPSPSWCYSYNRKKRYSTDSQNCSAQSSESTGPPGSPQEPADDATSAQACAPTIYHQPPPYIYPGYMFGPPIYNMNGVTMQGVIPQHVQLPPDLSTTKRRKKRRRRRRGGLTDDGSESSCCEEPLMCDVASCHDPSETSSDAVCQSGASSDAGAGPASDSGINTDPTPNSGSNSPPLHSNNHQFSVSDSMPPVFDVCSTKTTEETTLEETEPFMVSHNDVLMQDEYSEELSTAEEDMTPNLCAAAPEFSSQESTLSCMSIPSATRDLIINQPEMSTVDLSQEEFEFESCRSLPEPGPVEEVRIDISFADDTISESLETFSSNHVVVHEDPVNGEDMLNESSDKSDFKRHDPDKISESDDAVDQIPLSKLNDNDLDNSDFINGDLENELANDIFENSIQDSIASLKSSFDALDLDVRSDIGQEQTTNENLLLTNVINENENIPNIICQPVQEPEYCQTTKAAVETVIILPVEQITAHRFTRDEAHSLFPEIPLCKDFLTPVPPPRRKKSLSKAVDKLASKIAEDAIKAGVEEAAYARLKNSISITEAVTKWLHSQDSSPLTVPASDNECSEDEEEEGSLTDQKNVQGNPFLVPSHSGAGQRVAKDNESVDSSASALEWDLWDHSLCDPTRSVDKYYRLGADDAGGRIPPSIYKTAMHIRHTGPFPCGVCCIIQ